MKLSRGGVFVDLGAAQGFHSLFAARRVGNEGLVLAIEPDPNNVEVLTNLGRRSALENLRILPLAIWTKNGYVKLARGLDPLTGTIDDVAQTKIENGKGGQQGSYWGERIKVRARRLDKTLEEFSHHRHTRHEVDLLKIDVEGAELPILSDPSLDLRAVRNIVLEVHYPRESIEFGLIVRSLQRKGFSVKIMSDFTLALFKTKPPQLLCQRES